MENTKLHRKPDLQYFKMEANEKKSIPQAYEDPIASISGLRKQEVREYDEARRKDTTHCNTNHCSPENTLLRFCVFRHGFEREGENV
jgi:hypothetical protein